MVVGRVAGPFGVRGEIKVEPYTDDPDRFQSLRHVFLGPSHREAGVERSRKHKRLIVLKLAGIDTPEEVRTLSGWDVSIRREEALPLPAGHFYLEDAIGLRVVTADGREIGAVTEVLRTGGNEVFAVNRGREAILIPVIRDAIVDLDFEQGRVVVESWVLEPYV